MSMQMFEGIAGARHQFRQDDISDKMTGAVTAHLLPRVQLIYEHPEQREAMLRAERMAFQDLYKIVAPIFVNPMWVQSVHDHYKEKGQEAMKTPRDLINFINEHVLES